MLTDYIVFVFSGVLRIFSFPSFILLLYLQTSFFLITWLVSVHDILSNILKNLISVASVVYCKKSLPKINIHILLTYSNIGFM